MVDVETRHGASLLLHDSSLQLAVFSGDAVEVYASVEAAAVDDKLGSAVALHGLADDLFAKDIEHADWSAAIDSFCRIDADFISEWGWIDGVSEGVGFGDGSVVYNIEQIL